MRRRIRRVNNRTSLHGFTMIELVISLGILIMLLIAIPRTIMPVFISYREHLFLRRFEHDLKLAQLSSQMTGYVSVIEIENREMGLQIFGEPSLNERVLMPESMSVGNSHHISFEKGHMKVDGNSGGRMTFSGKSNSYTYVFQFEKGWYYVEEEPR